MKHGRSFGDKSRRIGGRRLFRQRERTRDRNRGLRRPGVLAVLLERRQREEQLVIRDLEEGANVARDVERVLLEEGFVEMLERRGVRPVG